MGPMRVPKNHILVHHYREKFGLETYPYPSADDSLWISSPEVQEFAKRENYGVDFSKPNDGSTVVQFARTFLSRYLTSKGQAVDPQRILPEIANLSQLEFILIKTLFGLLDLNR